MPLLPTAAAAAVSGPEVTALPFSAAFIKAGIAGIVVLAVQTIGRQAQSFAEAIRIEWGSGTADKREKETDKPSLFPFLS